MKRNELAGYYMVQYEDTDITITDVTEFDGGVVFDLSDGTHWLSDNNDTYQVDESLTDKTVGWDYDNDRGWVILNDDGSTSQIGWC